ncbi:IS66 family insertion sequence element accessory protein TnpB [Desulfobacula sp.]|uniref:IS66 family insertion sequence element accessory protein TnpB n=1 Tax=Desulfobacula sp. TaxID=2593537 RepID=UPI0039B85005
MQRSQSIHCLGTTDMRKAIDGLSILVSEKFNLDPFSGHLFAFCNRIAWKIKPILNPLYEVFLNYDRNFSIRRIFR